MWKEKSSNGYFCLWLCMFFACFWLKKWLFLAFFLLVKLSLLEEFWTLQRLNEKVAFCSTTSEKSYTIWFALNLLKREKLTNYKLQKLQITKSQLLIHDATNQPKSKPASKCLPDIWAHPSRISRHQASVVTETNLGYLLTIVSIKNCKLNLPRLEALQYFGLSAAPQVSVQFLYKRKYKIPLDLDMDQWEARDRDKDQWEARDRDMDQ